MFKTNQTRVYEFENSEELNVSNTYKKMIPIFIYLKDMII